MNQKGYVMDIIDEKTAKLKIQKHSACANCGKCKTLSSETKEILVEVDNTIGANIGNYVEVNTDNINVLKATTLVYIVPLVSLMLGVICSYFVLDKLIELKGMMVEIVSGLIGILLMLISYVVLKRNDNKFRESRKFIPIITNIIDTQSKN